MTVAALLLKTVSQDKLQAFQQLCHLRAQPPWWHGAISCKSLNGHFDDCLCPSPSQAGKNIERAADDAKDAASDAYETAKDKAR